MGSFQLADMAVEVNDEIVYYEPNTLSYTEGFGETTVRAASTGGGGTELIFARDVSNAKSMVKFELPTTPENIELVRSWQIDVGANVVGLSGSNGTQKVTRTLTQATVVNDPEINISADGTIEVEFEGNSVV